MTETADPKRILIVDDDADIRKQCGRYLERAGYEPVTADTAGQGLEALQKDRYALMLLDVYLPDFSGLELLEQINEKMIAACPVIVMTAHGSIDMAVTAMKLGAADYIQKPLDKKMLLAKVAENLPQPSAEREFLPASPGAETGIIGISTPMLRVLDLIRRAAGNDITVMIYGESGTGKELVARAIHHLGQRADEPFIPVDCTALAPSVVESELFGHVKGAYTNAQSDRDGLLRRAGRGTAFLDEIVSLSTGTQAKLLRVLQEKTVRPVGSDSYCPVEARVLAASNRDLLEAVESGDFREDLFYRLDILPIYLPPLRERKEDIPLLLDHFLHKHAAERAEYVVISDEAREVMERYRWPGNVRQLENTIQRALVLCDGDRIEPRHLPSTILAESRAAQGEKAPAGLIEQNEKKSILDALEKTNGNKLKAAEILGISRVTLYAKLKKYGL